MDHDSDTLVQLATRVPADVHRAARQRCVETDRTLQSFVIAALREKLGVATAASPGAARAELRRRGSAGAAAVVVGLVLALGATAHAAVAGLSGRAAGCSAGWDTGAAAVTTRKAVTRVLCHDGDPTCDADGTANGACTMAVRACVGTADASCTPMPVSRLAVSATARRLSGFTLPDTASGGCGSAGGAHLTLRGRAKDRPSRPLVLLLRARTSGGKGASRLVLQCLPPVAQTSCPDREASGLPKMLSFVVGASGSDLDNGWSGVSHNFPVVQGARLSLCLSGCDASTNPICQAHGDVGGGSPNGATFGPPLPLLAVGVPVCVVNRFAAPVDATANLQTGAVDGSLALASDVYTMTPPTAVCPRCDNDVDAAGAIGTQGHCEGGATPGAACTVEGVQTVVGSLGDPVYKLSSQCLPAGGLAGTLQLAMPLTTATSTLAGRCPGQQKDDACGGGTCTGACTGPATCATTDALGRCIDVKGGIAQTCCSNDGNRSCFPTATDAIVRTGTPAPLQPAWPDPTYPKTAAQSVLAATFCEPATGDATVDTLTGLPAPGAALFDGSLRVTAQD